MGEHDVNPECIERTATAVAEGHKLAFDLELKIQEMRRERESQLAEINKAIALQTVNINHLADLGKSNREDIIVLKDIAASLKQTVELLMGERNDKIKEQAESRKPVRQVLWSIVEKVIWVALTIAAIAIWQTYFGGSKL